MFVEETPISATTPNLRPRTPRRTPLLQRRPVVALLTTVFCLGLCFVGVNAAYPFVQAAHMRAQNDDVERDISRTRIQNQNDTRKLEALKTRDGQILSARQRGFLFPAERKLRIPGARQ